MNRLLKNTSLIIFAMIILSVSTVFAAGEKSLVRDTGDLAMSYGNACKITAEGDKEIIEAIKKTGKTDFKEGIYAEFFPWGDFGPGSSEQFLKVENVKDYDKLVFDVCGLTQEKFNDLEAYISWNKFHKEESQNYDDYKKDYIFTSGTNDKFNIETIGNGEFPSLEGTVQIWIQDGEFNTRYAIVASNQWETVELDISDFDGLTFYFSIDDSASVLVANPRLINSNAEKSVQTTPKLKAVPNSSKVLVNGENIEFDAYTIKGNNYFKLRDIAKVLSGTEKQFEVTWDGTKNVINLISGESYTVVGGELSKGDGSEKEPVESNATIFKDGEAISLKAYTIKGNNYFKLRDIGETFDFGITWDSTTKTIGIDTTTGYIPE